MSLSRQPLNILDLDGDVIEEIISYLSFDDIAKIRLVCRKFNETSQTLLNKGVAAVQLYTKKCQKEIRAKLPRRDSKRQAHPLAEHMDVLTGIESCLTMLFETYNNYIASGDIHCFIPGKAIDECYRLLKEVMTSQQKPLDSSELLNELDDISFTAADHFEECILPTIKVNQSLNTSLDHSPPFSSSLPNIVAPEFKIEDRFLIDSERKKITELELKVLEQEKELNDHKRKFLLLEKHLGLNLSQQASTSPVAHSSTTEQQSKRSLLGGEEPRPRKRLQVKSEED